MNDTASEVRSEVSEVEWELRVDLAACYRLVALYRWDDLIFTHISARVPGPDHHFLINPYGFLFEEITASRVWRRSISMAERSLMAPTTSIPPNSQSTVRSMRRVKMRSASSICTAATASPWRRRRTGVLPISQHSTLVLASLAYPDYEGLALNENEKPRLVRDLGDKHFFMLRNHGLLTVAETVADAFLYCTSSRRPARSKCVRKPAAS